MQKCNLYNIKLSMSRKIIITGGAGFIGTNFVHHYSKNFENDEIFIIESLTYEGNLSNLKDLINNSKVSFIKGNINDRKFLEYYIKEKKINHILNFAAESHVDRSIKNPNNFIKTNIEGTFNLLDVFKNYWIENNSPSHWRFLHVSTDEVFGSLKLSDRKFNENSKYCPRSPYSASKAASDHLVMAWFHTYGLPVIISNCSNNYGPFQFPEKLIPKTIISCLRGEKIPVYGSGKNIRDWLFVNDHVRALCKLIHKAEPGKNYCIGGLGETTNIEIVNIICDQIDEISKKSSNSRSRIEFVEDRLGHDFRYAIDSSRIKKDLNWSPTIDLHIGLKQTINWYISNQEWWEPLIDKVKR